MSSWRVWATDGAEKELGGGIWAGAKAWRGIYKQLCRGSGRRRIPAGPPEPGPHRCPAWLSICTPHPHPGISVPCSAPQWPGTGAKEAAVWVRGDREAGPRGRVRARSVTVFLAAGPAPVFVRPWRERQGAAAEAIGRARCQPEGGGRRAAGSSWES